MKLPAAVSIERCSNDAHAAVAAFYDRCGYTGGVKRHDAVFVAKEAGEIVAAARLSGEGSSLVLRGMQVAEPRRRKGIGSRLLAVLDGSIGERECFTIPYAHLESFYGVIGFKKIAASEGPRHLQARLAAYAAAGQDVILMRRLQARREI